MLGYLKAIGVLRLVSTQHDPAVGASWADGAFALHGITRAALLEFLEHDYQPTPALNPWNGGAGFDPKSARVEAGRTLAQIAAMKGERWKPYQRALSVAKRVMEDIPAEAINERKSTILTTLRSRYADDALPWLDAAVLFGGKHMDFPPLLGTGGNDGRLDFSINFAQRALDVVGDEHVPNAGALLRDALDGTSTTTLDKKTLGQFSLASSVGLNMTTGFTGDPLSNPWDFVLAIEGAMAFAGAVSRRLAADRNRISAPFTFRSIAAGFAAASADEPTRREIWLPCWRGEARYASVRALLRKGRAELGASDRGAGGGTVFGSTNAADSIAAVQAAQSLGVASGVASFSRIVVAQRNGLAFGATYAGQVAVGDRPEIAALAGETRAWMQRARNIAQGAAARTALRDYEERTIAYADRPEPPRFRAILLALAELDTALGIVGSDLKPLRFLSASLHGNLTGDGLDLDHRVARAIASLGHTRFGHARFEHRIRFSIAPIRPDKRGLVYDRNTTVTWRPDIRDTLAELFERRVREASLHANDPASGFVAHLHGAAGLNIGDFADVLAGRCNWRYVKELVRAYSIVEPFSDSTAGNGTARGLADDASATSAVPAAFAAIKWLADGVDDVTGKVRYLDAETAVALRSNHSRRAFDSAYARLRNSGVDVRDFRRTNLDMETARTFTAALCIPATWHAIRRFRDEATLYRSNHRFSSRKETA